jgi:predicted TPR repeat methyltransferase
VRAALGAAGLEDVQVTSAQPRLENKQPVDGLLVTARLPTAAER